MYKGPIFDVDIHHNWRSPEDVLQYLPRFWRDYLQGGHGAPLPIAPGNRRILMVDGKWRFDAIPADGTPACSDAESLGRQVLDPLGTRHALLNYDVGLQSGMPNPELAAALCRAANQYTVDHWLAKDERLCGMILVPTAVPEDAAREIEYWADNERMVGVLLTVNTLAKPFGHRIYDPIHRAASEHGRPIAIHLAGQPEGRDIAGGNPQSMLEQYPVYHQPGMHHVTSMITGALFEKFPDLRVMMLEWGFSWLPAIANRLETAFPLLKAESPGVRRRPSDVIREHLRFSSQPFEFVPAAHLASILAPFEGIEDVLCFSSDYPHWDADEPTHIASRLPRSWHHKFFHDNAAAFFGFPQVGAPLAAGTAGSPTA